MDSLPQALRLKSIQAIKTFLANKASNTPLDVPTILFVGGIPPSFVPTIIVLAEPLRADITNQEELVAAKIESFRQAGSNFKEIAHTDTTLGGREATLIEYQAILGGAARQDVAAFFIADGVIWSVTCASARQNFPQYKNDLYLIARSLRVQS